MHGLGAIAAAAASAPSAAAPSAAAPSAAAPPQVVKIPWRLTTGIFPVTASAGAGTPGVKCTFPMTIPGNGDFELWWHGLGDNTSASMYINVVEQNGRRWFDYGNQQNSGFYGVPLDLYAGTAAANGLYPEAVPYVMPANRAYNLEFVDYSGAANQVCVTWYGYLLSDQSQS
jgi:hypothetical protein